MRFFFSLLCLVVLAFPLSAYQINIQVPASAAQHITVELAVKDVSALLIKAGVDKVSVNGANAEVNIFLPELPNTDPLTEKIKPYPYVKVPLRNYHWKGLKEVDKYQLYLEAPGAQATAAGLYGLLQEVLDFNFYHPRQTRFPDLKHWPLKSFLDYGSQPRFNKMGFHLHTQHPLELTEALLDENFPGGEERVKEYIDWLARNRQNYFEFCLLETINRKTWPAYAARWVKYAKDRGIIPGLDLSLHMKQQVAFKLYRNPPKSFRSKEKQIEKRIGELSQAGWKVFNMEFSQTEFSSGNAVLKSQLREFIQQMVDTLGIHLTGREHVVKPETMVDNGMAKEDGKNVARDNQRGVMIHTVMFYTLNDEKAPVYGNTNLQHMRDMMLREKEERETWYYPESAYWITFDVSVPMLLTPYLGARLADILYCQQQDIEGHLTFSSGWEWGYWLIDWSIANWSWETTINGITQKNYPTQYFDKVFKKPTLVNTFAYLNSLQELHVKAENLIQFMVAHTVTDELPGKFRLPLHPTPEWRYSWLRNEASASFADSILQSVPLQLDQFADKTLALLNDNEQDTLWLELKDALRITALRAKHRAELLRFLCQHRIDEINKNPSGNAGIHLQNAANIRKQALQIVRRREASYRYPVAEMTTRKPDHTSYHFGYLYPVHDLHFWEREERQADANRWDFLFMNIWDVHRIIGITEKR